MALGEGQTLAFPVGLGVAAGVGAATPRLMVSRVRVRWSALRWHSRRLQQLMARFAIRIRTAVPFLASVID